KTPSSTASRVGKWRYRVGRATAASRQISLMERESAPCFSIRFRVVPVILSMVASTLAGRRPFLCFCMGCLDGVDGGSVAELLAAGKAGILQVIRSFR